MSQKDYNDMNGYYNPCGRKRTRPNDCYPERPLWIYRHFNEPSYPYLGKT